MGVVLLSRPTLAPASVTFAPKRAETVARVEFKAVKLMTKRRPKKLNKSDKNHKPAVYDAPPPPPPAFTILSP